MKERDLKLKRFIEGLVSAVTLESKLREINCYILTLPSRIIIIQKYKGIVVSFDTATTGSFIFKGRRSEEEFRYEYPIGYGFHEICLDDRVIENNIALFTKKALDFLSGNKLF